MAGASLQTVFDYLGIELQVRWSSDIRGHQHLKGQDRVLAICESLGATEYVNPIGGVELYDEAAFAARGIRLSFHRKRFISYHQGDFPFEHNLSMIDVLMHNDSSNVMRLLREYDQIDQATARSRSSDPWKVPTHRNSETLQGSSGKISFRQTRKNRPSEDPASRAKIMNSVLANPYDRGAVKSFEEKIYSKEKEDPNIFELMGKIRYLNDPSDFGNLNKLGEHYSSKKQYFLSNLCYSESIRLKPTQDGTYSVLQSMNEFSIPPKLHDIHSPEYSVSVIMGTYNRPHTIRESIDSVLNQAMQDFELIIVNDGGSDEVSSILKEYGSDKIKYHKLGNNSGHAAVLNEGIRRSRGRFIAYLDDDDVYYPDHLELLLNALRKGECKFAYSNTKMVCGSMVDGRFRAEEIKGTWNVEYDKNKLIADNFISNLSVLHEKSVFSDAGLFAEDLRVVMDWEMWLRISLMYDLSHVDAYTGEYRFKAGNITAADRLSIDFNTELVRNYYLYYRGLIAKHKYLLWRGMTEDAGKVYSEIRSGYKDYFKSSASSDELLDLSSYYHDDAFSGEIAVDYFNRDTRRYLKYVNESKRYGLLIPVSHLIPEKVVKVVRKRL